MLNGFYCDRHSFAFTCFVGNAGLLFGHSLIVDDDAYSSYYQLALGS